MTDADLNKMNNWLDTYPYGNADQNPDILITEDDAYHAKEFYTSNMSTYGDRARLLESGPVRIGTQL